MKSRAGYWLGAGLMVVAAVGFAVWLVVGIAGLHSTIENFARAPVPGEQTVRLEAHKYIVFSESTGALEPSFDIQVTDPETGRAVPIERYSTSLTYDFGHHGWARGTITPPHAGTYRVVTASDTSDGNTTSVAFGNSFAGRLFASIGGAFAFGAIAGMTGLILLIVTAVRRSRARRMAQQPTWQGGPGYQP